MKKTFLLLLAAGMIITSCNNGVKDNPLLQKWDTPFGIPPFEKVKIEHYKPAFLYAMKEHSKEIDAIVYNKDSANFENTIVALDNSGELLENISGVFGSDNSVNSNDSLIALSTEMSPLLSKHSDEISLNAGLFKRVKSVYDKKETLGLNPEQMRLLEETYKDFVRSGALLDDAKKEELKKLNEQISSLQLKFGQNLLKETNNFKLVVENEADLAGLSDDMKALGAKRAEKDSLTGKWVYGLDNPSIMPFLQQSSNKALRSKILDAYLNRCNNNNENDNKDIIKQLIDLRLQKAKLMGYKNFAEFQLENRMAKNSEAVYDLLNQIWTPALKAANIEAADIVASMKEAGDTSAFTAADWRYYFEKAKSKKFSLDETQLMPYFKLENVREGIFYVANKLYGITFTQLDSVPLPSSEAVAFECKDSDGSHLGVLFFDMFSRPGQKRGGAWCGGFRSQKYVDGKRVAPLVNIVGNFSRPIGDKPALLSVDETETFFHEFGHALASLLKNVTYSGLGGYTRDFVELPSQIMEHWAFEPEVLKVYAKHYQTGEVIPQQLVDKLVKSGKYGQGFATVEYLAASLLDMDYHVLNEIPADFDVLKFENKVLSDRGLISQIPPRYRSTYFQHTFTGGYTAGYYSYIWAEVLDADAFQAFKEKGNIFDPETAHKFRFEVLARANQDDAMNLYVNFRGKKPGIDALLMNRGLK